MPRWLSLVERETCNLVVAGSIPVRGLLIYMWCINFYENNLKNNNIYILLHINYN